MTVNTQGGKTGRLQAPALCTPKAQMNCPGTVQITFLCALPCAHSQVYAALACGSISDMKDAKLLCLMSQVQGQVAWENSNHSPVAAERDGTYARVQLAMSAGPSDPKLGPGCWFPGRF